MNLVERLLELKDSLTWDFLSKAEREAIQFEIACLLIGIWFTGGKLL